MVPPVRMASPDWQTDKKTDPFSIHGRKLCADTLGRLIVRLAYLYIAEFHGEGSVPRRARRNLDAEWFCTNITFVEAYNCIGFTHGEGFHFLKKSSEDFDACFPLVSSYVEVSGIVISN
jgi:hypothetical protein